MTVFTIQDRSYTCPVELAASVIKGKWKILILWHLRDETLRFSELRDAIRRRGDISEKVLSSQLSDLEADGLVSRTVYPEVPPRTEYALMDEGRRMVPALSALQEWGLRYKTSNSR